VRQNYDDVSSLLGLVRGSSSLCADGADPLFWAGSAGELMPLMPLRSGVKFGSAARRIGCFSSWCFASHDGGKAGKQGYEDLERVNSIMQSS